MKITIPITITLEYDGTETQYIEFGDRLNIQRHGEGLDSLDPGDATGAIVDAVMKDTTQWGGTPSFTDDWGNRCIASIEYDLFKYEGEWGQ